MDSLTLTLTWLFYVKYKQENALRVFPSCFPHGVNYFMSLRNVNHTTRYIAKVMQ